LAKPHLVARGLFPNLGVGQLDLKPAVGPLQPPRKPQQAAPAGPRRSAAAAALAPATWSTYVPILMYHYIRVNPDPRDRLGFSLSVTPGMFHAQMDYLARNGFHVVSLRDAVEAIRLHHSLPSRPIVLTFDDGYADFFTTAVPELQRHGFTATDFVVSGFVGRGGYMNWSQVQVADAMGFNIGAHTVDHVALTGVSPARAAWEIQQSKAMLEAMLGHPVLDFAYPYGSFNAGVSAQVRQAGFASASSTIGGVWHSPGSLMNLYRLRVGGGMSLANFAQLIGGPAPR